jgi:hypothetical protein
VGAALASLELVRFGTVARLLALAARLAARLDGLLAALCSARVAVLPGAVRAGVPDARVAAGPDASLDERLAALPLTAALRRNAARARSFPRSMAPGLRAGAEAVGLTLALPPPLARPGAGRAPLPVAFCRLAWAAGEAAIRQTEVKATRTTARTPGTSRGVAHGTPGLARGKSW